ncbi:MAG: hypothetical protein R3C49_25840 [Planctomycetaceae bacterium]
MVPDWIIGLLLVGYVLTIGPVDWLVLGALKLRRFTWLMFPIVTAVFTGITIAVAQSYMASSDMGGSLTMIDLVDDGVPVRKTEIHMHRAGAQMQQTEASRQAFVIDARNTSDGRFARTFVVPQRSETGAARELRYQGRFPQQYQTTQTLRQWEPRLNRTMTFSVGSEELPELPWADESLVTTTQGQQTLRNTLSEWQSGLSDDADPAEIDGVILNGRRRISLSPGNGNLFSRSTMNVIEQFENSGYEGSLSHQSVPNIVLSAGLLQAASRTAKIGHGSNDFFDIVFQVAPHGAATMEDLPLIDLSDDKQWLLMITVTRGNRIQVYRRKVIQSEI